MYNKTMLFPCSSLAFVFLYSDGHELLFQLSHCFAYLLQLLKAAASSDMTTPLKNWIYFLLKNDLTFGCVETCIQMDPPFQVTPTYAHHLFLFIVFFLFATNSISNDLIFSSRSLIKILNGMRAAPWRLLLENPLVIANAFLRPTNCAILNLFKMSLH